MNTYYLVIWGKKEILFKVDLISFKHSVRIRGGNRRDQYKFVRYAWWHIPAIPALEEAVAGGL
jgi:hypothetical protein